MSKRVRISNDSLNSYGTRVLTSGMNVEQYCRNPVLLYQHERGQVIGYVKDLKVDNDEVTGELMFDCASEKHILFPPCSFYPLPPLVILPILYNHFCPFVKSFF